MPNEETPVFMSHSERAKACVLVIESDATDRNLMRSALKTLGFGAFSDVPNHGAALEKLDQRKFTHIIFEATKTNVSPDEFLKNVLECDPFTVAIPSSSQPNVDNVFDLLMMGAKGYLCKPFTTETFEQAIVMASKGDPIAESVLHAKDRNEALVAITMASLDKAATVIRQASQFETARREVPKVLVTLRRSADLAKTFAKGGDEGLLEAFEKFCIERSQGPASRLGRVRKRLRTIRPSESGS